MLFPKQGETVLWFNELKRQLKGTMQGLTFAIDLMDASEVNIMNVNDLCWFVSIILHKKKVKGFELLLLKTK